MEKIKNFYQKHKVVILYMSFGVITTVVSLLCCYLTLKIGVVFMHDENGEPTELLDVLGSLAQWTSGVAVAFVTNKIWVFKGARSGLKHTIIQLAEFSGARVMTLLLEIVINLGAIALLEAVGYKAFLLLGAEISSRVWAKLISSIVIVISNYYISKLLVFRKKKDK